MEILKIAENCWFPSYNEAAGMLGLKQPIKLGYFTTEGFEDYFWYIEGKHDPIFLPLFRDTDMEEFRYYATQGNPYQLITWEPGDCFSDRRGRTYFYNANDLTIYRIVNFLSIKSVSMYAEARQLKVLKVDLVKLTSTDGFDERCAWILQGVFCKEGLIPMQLLHVFEEDCEAIFTKKWKNCAQVLCKGDTVIHDENIYRVGLNPQEGFALEPQRIDFDFNSLLKH